ncbi:MAG: RNA-binding S4 domain-containing protein [Pseudomonadota bacterium]
MSAPQPGLRIDKWLWHARFFKTRSLASKVVGTQGCRVNGTRVTKPASPVRVGDVLTFAKGNDIRVVKILALGERRGPAPEAQALYEDLAPPERNVRPPSDPGETRVGGRPTKKHRRALDALDREG